MEIWMVTRYNKNNSAETVTRLFYDKDVAFEFVRRDNARFSSTLNDDFNEEGRIGYSGTGSKFVYHVNLMPVYETYNSIKKPNSVKKTDLYPFWTSWWTSVYPFGEDDEDTVIIFPAKMWVSGTKETLTEGKKMYSVCALIKASDEAEVWEIVGKVFPDYDERFCTQKDVNFQESDLGDRFR